MNELPPDDPLLSLLETYTAAGSDIESRVMAQVEHEEAQVSLQGEITALRSEVTAMRSEIAELKRILLAGRAASAPSGVDSRGKSLLPYARPENTLSILS